MFPYEIYDFWSYFYIGIFPSDIRGYRAVQCGIDNQDGDLFTEAVQASYAAAPGDSPG